MEGKEVVIYERRVGPMMLSLLIGALVGAGVALLVAPQSGNETRRLIGERSNDVKNRAAQVVDSTRSKAQDAITNVRHRLGRGESSAQGEGYNTVVMEETIKRTYDL